METGVEINTLNSIRMIYHLLRTEKNMTLISKIYKTEISHESNTDHVSNFEELSIIIIINQ